MEYFQPVDYTRRQPASRPGHVICHWGNKELNIVSVFEAYGERIKGKISDKDYKGIIRNCMTVTGKTVGENLEEVPDLKKGQQIIHPFDNPIKKKGHIQILYGNLAEKGAVAKITGKEGELFSEPARVFENEYDAIEGIRTQVKPGEVIVIRNSRPKGAPDMPEMLKPTSAVMGAGLGKDVALITDGRFSGGSHGFVVGHITPEAYEGGTIGLIKNGDRITIDITKSRIDVDLTPEEIEARQKVWQKPHQKELSGVLKKYRASVSSASEGCTTV